MDSLQGVFINPAFIEPFGLTLIEVFFFGFSSMVKCVCFMTYMFVCFFLPSRLQPMVCQWLLQKMAVL